MNQNFSNNQNQSGLNNVASTTGTTGGVSPAGVNAGGAYSGISSTAGVNSNWNSSVTTGTVGNVAGTQNVQAIRQQIQTLQGQLRQVQTAGTNNEAYTDAANRLQDVYEILNKLS